MSSKILAHKVNGNQKLYLVQGDRKTGRKAQWKSLSELTDIIQDVIEYQVKNKTLTTPYSKQKQMEIQDPVPEKSVPKSRRLKKKKPEPQLISEQKELSAASNQKQKRLTPIKKRLRGPCLIEINKEQFQKGESSKRISQKAVLQKPRASKCSIVEIKQAFKACFAFCSEGINYYSVYFTDKTSQVLTTEEMMKRYPQLLIRTLEQLM